MEQSMQKYIGMLLENRYEILEVIGSGGMSVVYKALDSRLNRYVAVKVLRDEIADDVELRSRFQAEAQAVAMLAHPNIVAVYDVSHNKALNYIVMELIEGVTMKQYLSEKGKLSAKEASFFAAQICKALQHAHEHGIVQPFGYGNRICSLYCAGAGARPGAGCQKRCLFARCSDV